MSGTIITNSYVATRVESHEDKEPLIERKEAKVALSPQKRRGGAIVLEKIHKAITEAQTAVVATTPQLRDQLQKIIASTIENALQPPELRQNLAPPLILTADSQQIATKFLNLLQARLDATTLPELLNILEEQQPNKVFSVLIKKSWCELMWRLKCLYAEQEMAQLEKDTKITMEEYIQRRAAINALIAVMEKLAREARRIADEQNAIMMKIIGGNEEAYLQITIIQLLDAIALALAAVFEFLVTQAEENGKKGPVSHTFMGALFLVTGFLEFFRALYELKMLCQDYKNLNRYEVVAAVASIVGAFSAIVGCIDTFLAEACGSGLLAGGGLAIIEEVAFPLAFMPELVNTLTTLFDVVTKLYNNQASTGEVVTTSFQIGTTGLNILGFLLSGTLLGSNPIGWLLVTIGIGASIACKIIEKCFISPTSQDVINRDIKLAKDSVDSGSMSLSL